MRYPQTDNKLILCVNGVTQISALHSEAAKKVPLMTLLTVSALDFASLLDLDEYVVVKLSVYSSATLALSVLTSCVLYKFH